MAKEEGGTHKVVKLAYTIKERLDLFLLRRVQRISLRLPLACVRVEFHDGSVDAGLVRRADEDFRCAGCECEAGYCEAYAGGAAYDYYAGVVDLVLHFCWVRGCPEGVMLYR